MRMAWKKTLAALLAAAGMTCTCVPVYAEDTPALSKSAYTVTENEQGTVTIAFNEPIVLSLEESYAGSEAEEDDGVVPYGDVRYTYIPQEYWGTYISTGEISLYPYGIITTFLLKGDIISAPRALLCTFIVTAVEIT